MWFCWNLSFNSNVAISIVYKTVLQSKAGWYSSTSIISPSTVTFYFKHNFIFNHFERYQQLLLIHAVKQQHNYHLHNANALFPFIIEYIINQGIAVSHSKYHSLSIIIITILKYHSKSGRQSVHAYSCHMWCIMSHWIDMHIYMIPHLFVCTVSKPM